MDKFNKLIKIVKKLKAPDGCEWDRKQTHQSLTPYLLEETHEVIEAIENKDYDALKEELGDLLLHVIFQADLASDNNKFSVEELLDGINNKLIRRHPHIFLDDFNHSYKKRSWEAIKKKEKNRDSVLDGVPKSLPALLQSRRIQEKAAGVGFDWDNNSQVLDKVEEEILELKESIIKNKGINEELGDVLFTLVNLSRHLDIDPELSLKRSTEKFMRRFKAIEDEVDIEKLSLEELDEIWNRNKEKDKLKK
jgi:tetrapyrrole methylase family protein/MazG family protein